MSCVCEVKVGFVGKSVKLQDLLVREQEVPHVFFDSYRILCRMIDDAVMAQLPFLLFLSQRTSE